jgi:hypothetical protein
MIEGYPTTESTLGEFCTFYGYRVEYQGRRKTHLVDILDNNRVLIDVSRYYIHIWLKHRYATIKPHKEIVK